MVRPRSIVMFDRFYLGSVAFGLLAMPFSWSTMQAQLAANPQLADKPWMMGVVFGMVVIGVAISLLLWWFISRRASNVARAILVIFFVLGILGSLRRLAHPFADAPGTISLIDIVIEAVAIYFLFRPDARAWFAGEPETDVGVF